MKLWTGSYETRSTLSTANAHKYGLQQSLNSHTSSDSHESLWYYLGVYTGISVITCILGAARYLWVWRASLYASKSLFEKLTFTILRTPLRWLDTVPVGRILNRFTSDFHSVDSRLAYRLSHLLFNVLGVLGIIAAA